MAKKSRSQTAPSGTPKVAVAPASPDGPNRKVRKEDARRQREALQRKAGRRKFYRWGVAGAIVIAVAMTGTLVALNQKSSPTPEPVALGPGGHQNTTAPWTNGLPGLKQRLQAIGLPVLSQEALAFHIHMLLQVYVDGKAVPVPEGIGINSVGDPAVHHRAAHARPDGHHPRRVAPQINYTLGEFFDVWGVPLSTSTLGAYARGRQTGPRVPERQAVHLRPAGLVLKQHEHIVVTFGTQAQVPNPIP